MLGEMMDRSNTVLGHPNPCFRGCSCQTRGSSKTSGAQKNFGLPNVVCLYAASANWQSPNVLLKNFLVFLLGFSSREKP